jgi:diguanylate cyclase (GGDEF)-like protein
VTHPPNSPARPTDTPDRRIRRAWWIFATAFFVLGLISVLRVAVDPRPIDWALLGLVFVVGYAAIRHREAVSVLETGRREEAESFARILSSLSRSVSPDAILSAIVTELAEATGADHIVIARRRADARVLEATLVSARPGVPDSTTLMPIADLEDPPAVDGESLRRDPIAVPVAAPVAAELGGIRTRFDELTARIAAAGSAPGAPVQPAVSGSLGGGRAIGTQLVAERIATRARALFGLTDTLAAPLTSDHEVVGAIVLSRRTAGAWSATTRRILNGAAIEASAALARAYSLRAAEAKASTDALTGLPNRRYFDEFCGLLARRRRSGDAVGVLMIDIDRFKRLNDTFGHATGDEVLRAVGGAIVSAVREDDVPARYGGEEFVVLLRNPTPEVALDVGQRVREAVGALDLRKLGVGRVSVSVGVAVARQVDQPIPELIAEADKALYRAKRGGRDRVIAA